MLFGLLNESKNKRNSLNSLMTTIKNSVMNSSTNSMSGGKRRRTMKRKTQKRKTHKRRN